MHSPSFRRPALEPSVDTNVRPALERDAGGGRSAVEQPGDVGMLERGEDLPLGAETTERLAAGEAADQLDRDLLVELPVVAHAEPNHAHPPGADLAHEPVGTDGVAGQIADRFLGLSGVVDHALERRAGLGIMTDQRLDLGAEIRIIGAFVAQEALASITVHLARRLEQVVQSFPALGVHGLPRTGISGNLATRS